MRKNVRTKPHSPRYVAVAATVDQENLLDAETAIKQVKATATAKFVENIDLSIRLGVDPKKIDQMVRGITILPHGTGKVRKIAVLAKGDFARAAEDAGADTVGGDDLDRQDCCADFRDFDVVLATEEMAPQIGKIGRLLGPRTPNKRNGTVTNSIGQAVKEIKSATRVEYRTDKAGVVHMAIGKVNFTDDQLMENFKAALGAVLKGEA